MPRNGQSADDLPLAAYSTGVDPATEPEHEPLAPIAALQQVPSHASTEPVGSGPFAQAMPALAPADAAAMVDAPMPRMPFRDILRNPRGNARDPRLLLSGVVAIGLVLLVVSLAAGGGARGQGTALASPTAPAGPVATLAPAGDASVEFTGAVAGTFDLTGMTGTGRPSGTSMDSSWGDPAGDALALGGPVSSGTRATDEGFILSWTIMVGGKSVTFTSKAGECVVGMAVKPTTVSGSFTCHKVKSADGKLVVGATGTYRT